MCGETATDLSTLGRRLGYLRRRAGLEMGSDVTRKHIAKVLGVSQQIVGEWETDQKGPHRDRVPKIAAIYGIDAGWLLTGKGAPPATVRLTLKADHRRDVDLSDALRRRKRRKES